jgi:predicted alpha-1,2-mannosidase
MQTSLPRRYPDGARVGNEDLAGYLKYDYVPADGPDKGRTSCTLEYAYDDWCVGQLALALGHPDLAKQFLQRSQNWRNIFDPGTGFVRPRQADGKWVEPFDPYGAPGFVEGNAWQYTWFVPQDVPGLVRAMGPERFVSRLNEAFEIMAPTRFNAIGYGKEHPINQGNEPDMQAPWLFNWAGQPWLSQKWTRAVLDSYYGYNPADAYLGDEDQGQMGAWFVLSALGLYQTDGGCRVDPIFEIGSPLYPKITLHFPAAYGGKDFVIEARGATRENRYIQSASFNGRPWNQWWIRRRDVVAGGRLVLELGPAPNPGWAKGCPLPGD